MFKKQNGITLIALVITIIVMLILAGVVISMVVGDNGIITKSKTAKLDTLVAEVTQNLEGSITTVEMEEQSTTNSKLLANFKYVAAIDKIDDVTYTNRISDDETEITVSREFANIAKVLNTSGSATFFEEVILPAEDATDKTVTNAADTYFKDSMSGTAESATIKGSDGRTYTFKVKAGTITVSGGDLPGANVVSLTYKLTNKAKSYKISKPVIELEDGTFKYDGQKQSGTLDEILSKIS